jgi:hypothetical protein
MYIARIFHSISVSAVILLLLTFPASASPTSLMQLRAQFRGGEVYLQVALNDQVPVWMKVDLRANGSSLSPAVSRAIKPGGIAMADKTPRESQFTTMSVALGPTVIGDLNFKLLNASDSVGPEGKAFAGTLGGSFLGDRILIIKYREREVWISAPIPAGAAEGTPPRVVPPVSLALESQF